MRARETVEEPERWGRSTTATVVAVMLWVLTGTMAPTAALGQEALAGFLSEVDDAITLDPDGKKGAVEFTHKDHAGGAYLPGGDCTTCHHTQEGDAKPDPCSSCHAVGGEAGEKKAKTKASHSKKLGFPKASGVEQVSCVGCHKSQNELLEAGKREGESAPTKCKGCHVK